MVLLKDQFPGTGDELTVGVKGAEAIRVGNLRDPVEARVVVVGRVERVPGLVAIRVSHDGALRPLDRVLARRCEAIAGVTPRGGGRSHGQSLALRLPDDGDKI